VPEHAENSQGSLRRLACARPKNSPPKPDHRSLPTTHYSLPTKCRVAKNKRCNYSRHLYTDTQDRERKKTRPPCHLARDRASVCSKSPRPRSCNASSLCRRRNVCCAEPAKRGPTFLWESARVRTGNETCSTESEVTKTPRRGRVAAHLATSESATAQPLPSNLSRSPKERTFLTLNRIDRTPHRPAAAPPSRLGVITFRISNLSSFIPHLSSLFFNHRRLSKNSKNSKNVASVPSVPTQFSLIQKAMTQRKKTPRSPAPCSPNEPETTPTPQPLTAQPLTLTATHSSKIQRGKNNGNNSQAQNTRGGKPAGRRFHVGTVGAKK
jgi:hypothetical protein